MNRQLANLDYRELAQRALDGGFTVGLDGRAPTVGYAVSTRKDAEFTVLVSPFEDDSAKVADAIYRYVVDHGAELRNGFYLGAWRDGYRVVLDLVEVFLTRPMAVHAAVDADQDAIFDLAHSVEIRTAPAARELHLAALDDLGQFEEE